MDGLGADYKNWLKRYTIKKRKREKIIERCIPRISNQICGDELLAQWPKQDEVIPTESYTSAVRTDVKITVNLIGHDTCFYNAVTNVDCWMKGLWANLCSKWSKHWLFWRNRASCQQNPQRYSQKSKHNVNITDRSGWCLFFRQRLNALASSIIYSKIYW